MARVAVVGPGSVGVFFAGHLAAAGHDVIACARRPFDRYVIESDDFPLDFEATVVTDPTVISEPVEWVLLSVKAHQNAGAAPWLDAVCGPNTRVMVLQNGIEHDRVNRYIGDAELIPTVVYCGAELIAPGRIAHATAGFLMVPAEPSGNDMLALFADSQASVRPTTNFATHTWRKLSLNIALNGLTALTGRTVDVVADPGMRDVAIALMRETWEVARAHGADLDPTGVDEIIDAHIATGNSGGTSMLFDTRAGRPTEHDAIYGAALRAAAKVRIDTPTIKIIHALLDARNRPNLD